jgi:hypothetical protein
MSQLAKTLRFRTRRVHSAEFVWPSVTETGSGGGICTPRTLSGLGYEPSYVVYLYTPQQNLDHSEGVEPPFLRSERNVLPLDEP